MTPSLLLPKTHIPSQCTHHSPDTKMETYEKWRHCSQECEADWRNSRFRVRRPSQAVVDR